MRAERQLIQVRVSAYEKRRLREVAQHNHQTVADLLREALNEIIADCMDGPAVFKLRKNKCHTRPTATP